MHYHHRVSSMGGAWTHCKDELKVALEVVSLVIQQVLQTGSDGGAELR